MLNVIADYCTNHLIDKKVIERHQKDIYIYGFQLFFSTVSSVGAIILTAWITGMLKEGFLYLGVFMALRITANGYHASSYLKCFLLTNSLFLLYLFCLKDMIAKIDNVELNMALFLISIWYIWLKAPIEHPRHRLSSIDKKRNRLAARIISLILLAVVIVSYIQSWQEISYAIIATVYIVVLMMVVKNKDL